MGTKVFGEGKKFLRGGGNFYGAKKFFRGEKLITGANEGEVRGRQKILEYKTKISGRGKI